MNNNFVTREAEINDVRILTEHHAKMFEEIFLSEGKRLDSRTIQSLQEKYHEKLEKELPVKQCRSVVIEHNNEIVASGAFSVMSSVPVPSDLGYKVAYVHTIFTEKKYREKGLATSVLNALQNLSKESGIKRMFLNASAAGESTYRKSGFKAAPDVMRLFID